MDSANEAGAALLAALTGLRDIYTDEKKKRAELAVSTGKYTKAEPVKTEPVSLSKRAKKGPDTATTSVLRGYKVGPPFEVIMGASHFMVSSPKYVLRLGRC